MMVVNEMQFSDRQLYLTGQLYLLIRTGHTMAFSDRVSWRVLDMSEESRLQRQQESHHSK